MAQVRRNRWWRFRGPDKKELKTAVRARDGDDCWLCGIPMRFDGPPNCGKAATIEHLTPRAKGGNLALDNLCLCHAGCNRHLRDRTREQKERMRMRRIRNTATGHGALVN